MPGQAVCNSNSTRARVREQCAYICTDRCLMARSEDNATACCRLVRCTHWQQEVAHLLLLALFGLWGGISSGAGGSGGARLEAFAGRGGDGAGTRAGSKSSGIGGMGGIGGACFEASTGGRGVGGGGGGAAGARGKMLGGQEAREGVSRQATQQPGKCIVLIT